MSLDSALVAAATSVYTQLKAVGATDPEAHFLTAIAGAESEYDAAKTGDLDKVDVKWGPSVGWFQIRTLNGDKGKHTARDISALSGNTGFQCRAALQIKRGVNGYHNWTTYTSGAYGPFEEYATKAADGISDEDDGSSRGTFGQIGGTVGVVGDGVAKAAGGALSGIDAVGSFLGNLSQRATWVRVLQVVGGSGLVVVGIAMLGKDIAGPAVSAAANLNPVTAVAKTAASVASKGKSS